MSEDKIKAIKEVVKYYRKHVLNCNFDDCPYCLEGITGECLVDCILHIINRKTSDEITVFELNVKESADEYNTYS